MARDRITGLVLRDDAFESTTVQAKSGGKVDLSARIDLAGPPDAEEEKGGEPIPGIAEQIRPECSRLKGSTIVAGLATDQLLLRVVELPVAEPDEIAGMVSLQVDKFSPFPVDRMVVAYEVLHTEENVNRVLIAAVQTDVADAVGETLKQADISTDRVDAEIMGWWWILSDTGKIGTAGRQAFLFLDAPEPKVIVTQDGIPILFRSIAGMTGLTAEETVSEVAGELAHSLMSLELEHGGGAATTIHVWCHGNAPDGLLDALQSECDCKVQAESLDSIPPVSEGLARRAASRGAGQRLDLTPSTWRDIEKTKLLRKKLVVFSSSALLLWVLCLGGLLGGLAYERHRLESLKAELEELHGPAREVAGMKRRVFMIESYLDTEASALNCLREISDVQPDGIELSSFTYRKGESLSISGEADGVNTVYAFNNDLDACGLFDGSDLIGPRRDSRRRKDVFTIVLSLPGGPE